MKNKDLKKVENECLNFIVDLISKLVYIFFMLFDFQNLPDREDDYSVYYYKSEKCRALHSYGPVIKDHFLIHFIKRRKGAVSYQRP